MEKLNNSIPSNSVKLIELFNKITSDSLITGPDYQRKLVWKKQHKYAFIETILNNFPFPEIYIASEEMNLETLQAREVVVDGQQRLTTIVDYIQGKGDFMSQNSIIPFSKLTPEAKRDFLNYSISVRDLKDIGMKNIKEVFSRINSTDYSLNSNEILNAQYGGGEFAIFSKLLVDIEYQPTAKETDIQINYTDREIITNFFKDNNIFNDNDIKRMFDYHYIMLITSTILEGRYFGRNTKINEYLERYNLVFGNYNLIIDKVKNAVCIIKKLKLSVGSYWFNKANLFTLIVELSKIEVSNIDPLKLEFGLVDLESKVDVYFNGDEDEVNLLTNDETKYFEYARQGSHELAAREHRGRIIRGIIDSSIMTKTSQSETPYTQNVEALNESNIPFTILIPTKTGLTKNIMDATSTVRDFLRTNKIHDYSTQVFGPTHKKIIQGGFIDENSEVRGTEVSLYRSNGRGDFRIWFSDLKTFANDRDELALIVKNGELVVLNLNKYNYSQFLKNLE